VCDGPGAPPRPAPPSPPPGPGAPRRRAPPPRGPARRPKSIELKPRPGAPDVLDISFTFDATKPCLVSTFVMATESVRTMELTPAGGAPDRLPFPAGLGQRFEDPTGRHSLDLSRHPEPSLTSAAGSTYPLAIRLEVAGLGAGGEGLAGLPPGCAQEDWMQSHTTLAELVRGDGGAWSVRVLKQKIWHEGTPYELQEIYGLGAADGDAGAAGDDDDAMTECIICMTNDREVALLPCRHMCMCAECARIMMSPHNTSATRAKCPICRRRVHNYLSIRQEDRGRGGGDGNV